MNFQHAPLRINSTLPDPKIEPQGMMKPYLGPQYDSEKIADNQEDEEFAQSYEYLRAFPVLSLLGAEFTVQRDSELSTGLLRLLNSRLPGIGFEEADVSPMTLRKYHFIHVSVPAPIDQATRQPMALEIYASLKNMLAPEGSYEKRLSLILKEKDIFPILEYKAEAFPDIWQDNGFRIEGYILHELVAQMTLEITKAVYSNIQYPNISGTFYL
jgi:hypothetical protein